MGFRFYKRIKILPGLYWNVGGKRSSFSVKIGGLTKNFSERGTRTTISAPGTGMSFTSFKPRRGHSDSSLPPPFPGQVRRRSGLLGALILLVFAAFIVAGVMTSGTPPANPASAAQNAPTIASTGGSMPATSPLSPNALASVKSPSASLTVNSSEAAYHGTTSTAFRKNWVMVDKKVIMLIQEVHPAPGGQVLIVTMDGEMKFPASTIPQGFLDAWNVSPAALKSAERR